MELKKNMSTITPLQLELIFHESIGFHIIFSKAELPGSGSPLRAGVPYITSLLHTHTSSPALTNPHPCSKAAFASSVIMISQYNLYKHRQAPVSMFQTIPHLHQCQPLSSNFFPQQIYITMSYGMLL